MFKKSDLKIEFINFVENPFEESISYPMGILYISSYLKKYGFTNIGLVDHVCFLRSLAEKEEKNSFKLPKQVLKENHVRSIERLFVYLNEKKPHIILLGPITSLYLIELVDLLSRLRENFPDSIILAGGPHFGLELNLDYELLQSHPNIDSLTIGESEETIVEFVELAYRGFSERKEPLTRYEFRDKLMGIPGILTYGNKFQPRKLLNLEELPPPDMELLNDYWKSDHIVLDYEYRLSKRRNPLKVFRGYFEGDSNWGAIEEEISSFPLASPFHSHLPFGVIMGSRGCPFKCSFCSSAGRRRTHSARYILDRIYEMNERYGMQTFAFFDSLFTTASLDEQKRISELCNLISASHLNIKYLIEIRADIVCDLPEDLIALMIRSGCTQVNLGLEKGSDESLQKMMKGSSIKLHYEAVDKLRRVATEEKKEILINGTFILGGPGESRKDILDTLIHCWSLNLDEHTFYIMDIYPGTKIYHEALKEGILESGLIPYLEHDKFPQYVTNDLPLTYLSTIKRLNEQAVIYLRDFKQAMFEIENQFLPESERAIGFIEHNETRALNASFQRSIEKMMEYLKMHKKEGLQYNGECVQPLKRYIQEVEEEISLVEKRLCRRYPNYNPEYGDYHLGALKTTWHHFLASFRNIFDINNFNTVGL